MLFDDDMDIIKRIQKERLDKIKHPKEDLLENMLKENRDLFHRDPVRGIRGTSFDPLTNTFKRGNFYTDYTLRHGSIWKGNYPTGLSLEGNYIK